MGSDLHFWGATGTVTGSRFLVEHDGRRVLVDCGLFQGYKQLRLRNWAPPPFDPAAVDAVLLTHAHIDHSGALPLLAKQGFRGRVHCTEATYELCRILLPDSAWLQEEQAEHANRHGWSKHAPALPLYTRVDAERALALFAPIARTAEVEPIPGLRARFARAGHILGASSVRMQVGNHRVVFSGDLGRPGDLVMREPDPLEASDTLVLESTYGNRMHRAEDSEAALGALVSAAAARGGTTIIPCFAVGRAQVLLHFLDRLRARGEIPPALRIYLDSPMARDVTGLYRRFREEHRLDEAATAALARVAHIVNTPEESRGLDESDWPKVILAGSGMATGGRVLHHLVRYAPDPRTLVLFAGFQGGGTRGDALVHGARSIRMFGRDIAVRAQVATLETLSAHADWREILDWVRPAMGGTRRIFLTHGEPAAADALRRRIAEAFDREARVPEYGERVTLD